MNALTVEDLCAIERLAERAPHRMLMLMAGEIVDALQEMNGEEAEYARALLLKMERLSQEQLPSMVLPQQSHDMPWSQAARATWRTPVAANCTGS